MRLETKRLSIRPVEPGDKESVFLYRSHREVNKYQGFIPDNLSDVERFIANTAKEINTPGTWFQLVLILKESGALIGDIGLHFAEAAYGQDSETSTETSSGMVFPADSVEIGYTLDVHYHGKGYATEALTAIIEYLKTAMGKKIFTASVDPENAPSIRVLERAGFSAAIRVNEQEIRYIQKTNSSN